MDPVRFDALAKILSGTATRRTALAALAAAFSGGARRAAAARGTGKQSQGAPKVPVCHNGKTLSVSIHAAKAHLDHGDTLGPCDSAITQPPPPTGGCTPLLQICWPSWLGGNPCCDAEADCFYVNSDVPAFFCLDKKGCTSDADCRARFTDPNIACLHSFVATCPEKVRQCCQRKLCPGGKGCEAGVACCTSPGSNLQEVCCAPNQICNGLTGCVTP